MLIERSEAEQALWKLQFKKVVTKKCKPVPSQIKVYVEEDQKREERRL